MMIIVNSSYLCQTGTIRGWHYVEKHLSNKRFAVSLWKVEMDLTPTEFSICNDLNKTYKE